MIDHNFITKGPFCISFCGHKVQVTLYLSFSDANYLGRHLGRVSARQTFKRLKTTFQWEISKFQTILSVPRVRVRPRISARSARKQHENAHFLTDLDS